MLCHCTSPWLNLCPSNVVKHFLKTVSKYFLSAIAPEQWKRSMLSNIKEPSKSQMVDQWKGVSVKMEMWELLQSEWRNGAMKPYRVRSSCRIGWWCNYNRRLCQKHNLSHMKNNTSSRTPACSILYWCHFAICPCSQRLWF